ncbi:MAG: hypothetical protein AAB443_02400 [Patescibacteria group bacterium]
MRLTTDPDTEGARSMRILGVERGQDWDQAREKLCQELMDEGASSIRHVLQAILGKELFQSDARYQKWSALLMLPTLVAHRQNILNALDKIAKECLA